MKRFANVAALVTLVMACQAGSDRDSVDTAASSAPAAAPAPGAPMQPDTASRTVDSASRTRDTTGGDAAKAAASNQTQSGVTNTKTGKSTLGPGVRKAEPTQGQPVTSKGDTLVRRKTP